MNETTTNETPVIESMNLPAEELDKIFHLLDGNEHFPLITQTEKDIGLLLTQVPSLGNETFSERLKEIWDAFVAWVKKTLDALLNSTIDLKVMAQGLKFHVLS